MALTLGLPEPIALGLLIVSCMPGGTTSNIFTYFSKGNLALSVLMTVTSTVFGVILIPVVLLIYASALDLEIPRENIIATLEILLVPVAWVPRNWQFLMTTDAGTYFAAIMLGVFGISTGYGFAKLLRLHPRNARTVALESGIQIAPLAIAIIVLTFPGEEQQSIIAVGALYSLFIVMTSTAFTLVFRRANTAAEQKLPDSLL
mgnify:CR=1 FL=1